jgi:hypothetical protein
LVLPRASEIKGIQIGKEEVKLSLLFGDDMILYIENPKDSVKTIGINKCNAIVVYKVNTKKASSVKSGMVPTQL